jgi:hypothetical protein
MADNNPNPGATDIFGTNYNWGGSWKLDGAVIGLHDKDGNATGKGLIVNSCQIQYARPVNKIIPLNTTNQFLIAGRGAGTLTLGMVVGPSDDIATFLKQYSNPCNVKENAITIAATGSYCTGPNEEKGNVLKFVCNYCLLQSINSAVQAGDIAIVSAGMTLVIGVLNVESSKVK